MLKKKYHPGSGEGLLVFSSSPQSPGSPVLLLPLAAGWRLACCCLQRLWRPVIKGGGYCSDEVWSRLSNCQIKRKTYLVEK